MKFGQIEDPEKQPLPPSRRKFGKFPREKVAVAVGLGMWNRLKIKNFYPRGVTAELPYYSSQFNSIELNATFHKIFAPSQIRDWKEMTAPYFTFVPKVPKEISHVRRLRDFKEITFKFVESISNFGEKLGPVFVQAHNDFGPQDFGYLREFVENWKQFGIPLAVEVRNAEWHNEPFAGDYYRFLEQNDVANVLIDTAGRRDLLHMRMTTQTPFIRWVGCNNDEIDYTRLDAWAGRISEWQADGLRGIGFFIHQNDERESAKLAAYFIQKLNDLGVTDLEAPTILNAPAPHLLQT